MLFYVLWIVTKKNRSLFEYSNNESIAIRSLSSGILLLDWFCGVWASEEDGCCWFIFLTSKIVSPSFNLHVSIVCESSSFLPLKRRYISLCSISIHIKKKMKILNFSCTLVLRRAIVSVFFIENCSLLSSIDRTFTDSSPSIFTRIILTVLVFFTGSFPAKPDYPMIIAQLPHFHGMIMRKSVLYLCSAIAAYSLWKWFSYSFGRSSGGKRLKDSNSNVFIFVK